MPRGAYRLLDPHTGAEAAIEEFDCAPGPAGWRYAARRHGLDTGSVDVTLDAAGRQIRVHLAAAGWMLRGGVAGSETVWLRVAESGDRPEEHGERAAGFTGGSPAFLVATARLLRAAHHLGPGEPRSLALVEITTPALAATLVRRRWTFAEVTEHPTPSGPLPVERWEVDDLATGERGLVHLTGDVVVDAPGLELTRLDSPPTTFDR